MLQTNLKIKINKQTLIVILSTENFFFETYGTCLERKKNA